MTDNESSLDQAPLGKKSSYVNTYTASLLFPIPRKIKRDEIGLTHPLPFRGYDIWNGYELSWLNSKGKPIVAIGEFRFPCDSPCIIESKSFKLYLNSFNNSRFDSFEEVKTILENDLSQNAGTKISVKLFRLDEVPRQITTLSGSCLDELDIECSQYLPDVRFLAVGPSVVEETLFTNLLKSNCLVTGQPDWGSLQVQYRGHRLNPEGLLKYIVSLRDHNEFHEQCVERIFFDILRICKPTELSVNARYTRRGGLDINPYRTTLKQPKNWDSFRLVRQ